MSIPHSSGNYMEKPLKVLHSSLNNRVIVELRNRRAYHGILDGYDVPHMNLVLKNADEIVDGESIGKHDMVIVRGDNIIYVSP